MIAALYPRFQALCLFTNCLLLLGQLGGDARCGYRL